MMRFKTYAAIWSWERRIYRLERVRLPMPVTFRWIGCFIGALFLVTIPVNKLPLVSALPWEPLRYVIPPILIANWLTKARLDGKTPMAWMLTMLAYLWMHKQWAGYQPLKPGQRGYVTTNDSSHVTSHTASDDVWGGENRAVSDSALRAQPDRQPGR